MKYLLFSILFFVLSHTSFSQEDDSFKAHKAFYIYGDATFIGNNILSENATKPFNEAKRVNDEIKMKYVDIDADASTFSSSEASLKLPENTQEIAFAGLYWSAIYGYDKGVKRILKDKIIYKGNNKRDSLINFIKFKTPSGKYRNLKGDILFDGYKKKFFANNSPYVCFADVTEILQKEKNINGNYTVANIKATQGFISGGSAAGWILYVVYKSETENPKYISIYNGIKQLSRKPAEIVFQNFNGKEIGETEASITLATLEGDSKIKTDKCSIYNTKLNTYVNLTNEQRPETNFFNSTISINNDLVENRFPNSNNTLGFDIAEVGIPNTNNALIDNNTNETKLLIYTKADRFYLFFTAFKTEISEACYLENNAILQNDTVNNTALNDSKTIVSNPNDED